MDISSLRLSYERPTMGSQKNLLDLQHSETISKGTTCLSIGLGSFPGIVISMQSFGMVNVVVVMLSLLFSAMFIFAGVQHFNRCKIIRERISHLQ